MTTRGINWRAIGAIAASVALGGAGGGGIMDFNHKSDLKIKVKADLAELKQRDEAHQYILILMRDNYQSNLEAHLESCKQRCGQ